MEGAGGTPETRGREEGTHRYGLYRIGCPADIIMVQTTAKFPIFFSSYFVEHFSELFFFISLNCISVQLKFSFRNWLPSSKSMVLSFLKPAICTPR